jgi:hypothetical protein
MFPSRHRHGTKNIIGAEDGGRLAVNSSLPARIVNFAEDEEGGGGSGDVEGEAGGVKRET